MRRSNVVQFPSEQSGGGAGFKIFAALFYLYLAYMMTLHFGMSGDGLGLLMLLALLYAVFVRKQSLAGLGGKGPLIVVAALAGFFLILSLLSGQSGTIVMMASLALVAGVYWLMIGRSGKEAPYFVRFHLLTALVLNFFLLLGYMLLGALLKFLMTFLVAVHLSDAVLAPIGAAVSGLWSVMLLVFWGLALYLVANVLLGRAPYIPLVTPNVRHWV